MIEELTDAQRRDTAQFQAMLTARTTAGVCKAFQSGDRVKMVNGTLNKRYVGIEVPGMIGLDDCFWMPSQDVE